MCINLYIYKLGLSTHNNDIKTAQDEFLILKLLIGYKIDKNENNILNNYKTISTAAIKDYLKLINNNDKYLCKYAKSFIK